MIYRLEMTKKLISKNPSNGDYIGEVTVTSHAQLTSMVKTAKASFNDWRVMSTWERAKIVTQAFESLAPMQRDLAKLLSMEMGKTAGRSMGEVSGVIHSAEYFAHNVANALKTEKIGMKTQIQHRPLGVVAVISPWNYPLAMAANLIVPALVAGNTVVFKPSEETPIVANEMVAALNEFLPQGVLQIAHGGREVGQNLVEADVNLIAFTGSQQAGRDIMKRASGTLKRLIMELGGNDPMIVMASADIDAAAQFAVASSFENSGQMCVSTERVYVDEAVADEFEARVVAYARQYHVGTWDDRAAAIGPLINDAQYQKVNAHIVDALTKGATLALGGEPLKSPFVPATVLTNMTPAMLMESEETFGPVVAIARFSDIEDAIRRSNDSDFGLGAVVFGAKEAHDVADQLEAGMVSVNQSVGGEGDSPWVGAKQSGFGFRGSVQGHQQFTQVRVFNK